MSQTKKTTTKTPVILISGFGPFDAFGDNPSSDIATLFDGTMLHNCQLVGVTLRVSWEDAWKTLEDTILQIQPDAILCLGLAPEDTIRLEQIARNETTPLLDVDGLRPQSPWVVANAIEQYTSSLPIDWLKEAYLNIAQVYVHPNNTDNVILPIRLSSHAGFYLCNYIFYQLMHALSDTNIYRGFVHIPAYSSLAFEKNIARQKIFKSSKIIIDRLAFWVNEQMKLEQVLL